MRAEIVQRKIAPRERFHLNRAGATPKIRVVRFGELRNDRSVFERIDPLIGKKLKRHADG